MATGSFSQRIGDTALCMGAVRYEQTSSKEAPPKWFFTVQRNMRGELISVEITPAVIADLRKVVERCAECFADDGGRAKELLP